MRETWPAWRLVVERVASLVEVQTQLSLVDVMDANDVLDLWQKAKADAVKRSRGTG